MGKRGKEVWLSGLSENRNGGLEKCKEPWRVCECKGKPGVRGEMLGEQERGGGGKLWKFTKSLIIFIIKTLNMAGSLWQQ